MVSNKGDYALLFLPAALIGSAPTRELLLPVTLACLLSAHLRFIFPMRGDISRAIDSIFDDHLKKLILKSQGIYYAKDSSYDEISEIAEKATLLVTSDQTMKKTASDNKKPYVFFSQVASDGGVVKLGYVNLLDDDELKWELAGYSKLLNIQSSLFVSGSLSSHPETAGMMAD